MKTLCYREEDGSELLIVHTGTKDSAGYIYVTPQGDLVALAREAMDAWTESKKPFTELAAALNMRYAGTQSVS
jgi:hypothetical protein